MLNNISELAPLNQSFQNGEQLTKDSFNFLTQIGSGAFGKVYKVSSKTTGQIHALKVLSKNQITNLKLTDQLRNEIALLARCKHKNIVKLFCAFEDKGYIFLIMEMASEGTLYQKLKKMKKFDEQMVADYMTDIIRAVAYLHEMDPPIIHRDLKPENVLLSGNILKLADFGWSNVKDDYRNTFCGTPDYLSPEMIIGSGHSEKLDIWTLGVLMFEMLHGRPPFSPNEKIRDRRLLQKTIEDNIMKGKVDFGQDISYEARSAINVMLNPNEKHRPFAKDIFNMDFFKKYDKRLVEELPQHVQQHGNPHLMNVLSLKQKVEQYEQRLDHLAKMNKSLSELCEKKDALIGTNLNELEMLTKKNNSLVF